MSEKNQDYVALDAAIVMQLKVGPKLNMALFTGNVRKEADALEIANRQHPYPGRCPKPAFRFVDMRLQELRKKGVIVFNSKIGWSLK